MLDKEELLFDELYEKTKGCGRTQFIKLLMEKDRKIKELKEKLDEYENPEDMTLMMMWCTEKVKDENQKLKKQLEKKQNPLQGIFSQVNDDMLLRDCGAMQSEIDEYKTQQKEFIKYLEDLIKQNETVFEVSKYALPKNCSKLLIDFYKEILQKYKEIIGENDV